MTVKVVFMGSPEFSLPTLKALAENYPVAGVITQPDRPAGRGRVLTPPPVKDLAVQLGIETIQPQRLREPEAQAKLQAWQPDLIVVAAFGQILRPNVLDLPKYGCVNVHASFLPRWRGAAPIQAAILNGDDASGVSIMKMDAGIDTGPWVAQCREAILPDDTSGSLSARLAQKGAELLIQTLPGYLDGSQPLNQQDESQATYAGMLKKEEGHVDFHQPAEALARKVRAFNPWPGAFTLVEGLLLKIHRAHAVGVDPGQNSDAGQTTTTAGLPAIVTGQGLLVLDEVQPAGKKSMPGAVFLNGNRQWGKIRIES